MNSLNSLFFHKHGYMFINMFASINMDTCSHSKTLHCRLEAYTFYSKHISNFHHLYICHKFDHFICRSFFPYTVVNYFTCYKPVFISEQTSTCFIIQRLQHLHEIIKLKRSTYYKHNILQSLNKYM